MSYGILLLRAVVGLTMAAHGAQKLFGAFGGGGPRGTAGFFAQLGFRAPLPMALAAGLAELGGGLMLAAGLAVPLASLALVAVLLNAIVTSHLANGFWNVNRGYEYNVVLIAVAVALAATGGGRFSLDAALGWEADISGLWWGVAVLLGAAVGSAATLTFGRTRAASETAAAEDPHLSQAA
jgi:putative oxidoreductase